MTSPSSAAPRSAGAEAAPAPAADGGPGTDALLASRDAGPPPRRQKKVYTEANKAAMLEAAAHMAADMELGSYIDAAGSRWEARRYATPEILIRLGYKEKWARKRRRPAWWPGVEEFRRYVEFIKTQRQIDYRQDFQKTRPILEMIFVAAAAELAERLMHPMKRHELGARELTELLTKLNRAYLQAGARPPVETGASPAGVGVYREIRETILRLPEGTARSQVEAFLRNFLREGLDAVEVPAKEIPAEAVS